jgi:hypothetical protein
MDNRFVEEAIDLWRKFEGELLYSNRFFPTCELTNYFEELFIKSNITLKKQSHLFRARLYDENNFYKDYKYNKLAHAILMNAKVKEGFYGYDEYDSGAPSSLKATAGRANPEKIPYLYLADNEYTSLVEIRTYLKSKVSIAKFEILEDIKLVDFSSFIKFDEIRSITEAIEFIINYFFSKPVNDTEKENYILTQYIAEYIKNKGMDGIKYRSSLSSFGNNVTLFDINKVKAISSNVFEVNEISYNAKCKDNGNERELICEKR